MGTVSDADEDTIVGLTEVGVDSPYSIAGLGNSMARTLLEKSMGNSEIGSSIMGGAESAGVITAWVGDDTGSGVGVSGSGVGTVTESSRCQ